MFYHYIYSRKFETNWSKADVYNFLKISDKNDKINNAAQIIKNESNYQINKSYIEEDSLFLNFSFIYNINTDFCINYCLGNDNRDFTNYYNTISGKRKSKISEDRFNQLKNNVFENAYESGYDHSFFGKTFFFKDMNNNIKYGHKTSLVFFYSKPEPEYKDCYSYVSFGSLNNWKKENNYFVLSNKSNNHYGVGWNNDINKSVLMNKQFKDIDTYDFIRINHDTVFYNYLINFKHYINTYDFSKDLSNDLYCHNIDMSNSEIYKDYYDIYSNHQSRIKELFKEYLNKMTFKE